MSDWTIVDRLGRNFTDYAIGVGRRPNCKLCKRHPGWSDARPEADGPVMLPCRCVTDASDADLYGHRRNKLAMLRALLDLEDTWPTATPTPANNAPTATTPQHASSAPNPNASTTSPPSSTTATTPPDATS